MDPDRSIFVALYFNPCTSVFLKICLYLNSIFCNLVTVCVLIRHFPPNLRKCQNRLSALRESAYVDELRRCNSHQGWPPCTLRYLQHFLPATSQKKVDLLQGMHNDNERLNVSRSFTLFAKISNSIKEVDCLHHCTREMIMTMDIDNG